MRRLAAGTAVGCLLVALLVAQPAAAASGMRCSPVAGSSGRLLTCTVALPKGVAVRSSTVRVVLPAGYGTKAAEGRRYPVVYVLHGVGDTYATWTTQDRGDLVRRTASCQAIFVTPDAGGGSTAGWYSDWKDGRYQYETFHTAVLPRAVDAAFRTQGPGHRAVAGLSMGGFGALSYTARHPGMFRSTASYSAFADSLFGAPVVGAFYELGGQNPFYSFGTPSKGVWGDQRTDRATWAAHNPTSLADRFRGQPLFLSSGHGAPGGSQGDAAESAPAYFIEAYVGQLNDRFARALTERGIAFTDARELGGRHDWPYWRAAFSASLPILMRPLGAASRGCGA